MPTRQLLIPLESAQELSEPSIQTAAASLLGLAAPPPKPSPPAGLPHLAPPSAPHLAPAQSWSDEEGTAALLLPDARSLLGEPPRRTGQPAKPQAARKSASLKLILAGLSALALFIVLLAGARLMRSESTPASSIAAIAARQQLMDEAMSSVRSGQLEQALSALQRFQGSHPDPAVDLMIASLKRQLGKR